MIGNITKGNGFYGCVAYVLGKENAQLINSNMASTTPTGLAWEFRKFAQLNQRVEKPVLHLSISPAPGDRILDEWELCMITQDLLEGLELSNNQFILVQHNDAEYEGEIRPHIHMVINRVSVNGKCNDDYLDFYRTEKLLRQIEKDYDLIPQPSSWEVEKKKAYPQHIKDSGELNIVERLQNAIETAASDKPEMPVFVARLLKDNIQINCKFTRTGKLKGISYCMEGEAFKGGNLGKLYSHIGIRKHLGVGYQQYYSNPISSLIESYKRGRTINDEWVEHLKSWCRSQDTDIEIAPQQPQPVEENSVPQIEEEKSIIPEIIIPKGDNSDSTSESTTDNTSVVEKKEKNYVSVVPSIEEVFGTSESNKASKKLNKYKETSNLDKNKDGDKETVEPTRPTYKSVVPSVEEIFPKFKDSEEKENITQADINIETQQVSTPEPEPEVIKPSSPKPYRAEPSPPEPQAAKIAVIIAAYMGNRDVSEFGGESMEAKLTSNASCLEVRRKGSDEVILGATYSDYGNEWIINHSKKFTDLEKKKVQDLKDLINRRVQQPDIKKGFEQ